MRIVAIAFLGCAATAHAQTPAPHPCERVRVACEAAGYVRGGAKAGKGLYKDCIGPLVHGQPVAGVSVDPTELAACKAKAGSHRPPPSAPAP